MPAQLGQLFSGGYMPQVQQKESTRDMILRAIIPTIAQAVVGQVGKGIAATQDNNDQTGFWNTTFGGQTNEEMLAATRAQEEADMLKRLRESQILASEAATAKSNYELEKLKEPNASLNLSGLSKPEQQTYRDVISGAADYNTMADEQFLAKFRQEMAGMGESTGKQYFENKKVAQDVEKRQLEIDKLRKSMEDPVVDPIDRKIKNLDLQKKELELEKLKTPPEPKPDTTGHISASDALRYVNEGQGYQFFTASDGKRYLINDKKNIELPIK